MTYEIGGKQYLVLTTGSAGRSSLVALSLPDR
jgi:hypothetical protein